jgi:phosphatidylglycerophosphatase A
MTDSIADTGVAAAAMGSTGEGALPATAEPATPRPMSGASAPASKIPWWALLLSTWCGAGLSPRAPGTVGSLASLALWAPLVLHEAAWWQRLVVAIALFVVGVVASEVVVKARGEDPQIVVIDEVVGMGVTLLLVGAGWPQLVAGFLCFRVFDIWKPWPVRVADARVGGGFGVMLDDVLAGLYALAAVSLIERFVFPLLLPLAG